MTLLDETRWTAAPYSGGGSSPVDGARDRRGTRGDRRGIPRRCRPRRAASRDARSGTGPSRPPEERAAVLRRAGLLWQEHAAEIEGWIVRETGAIPPKAAARDPHRGERVLRGIGASVLPPRGRAHLERATMVVRAAVPGRRRERDRAVQLPADPRDPRGRAGAGARQRGAAEAGPAHRRFGRREHRAHLRGGRAARWAAAPAPGRGRHRRGGRRPRPRCASSRSPVPPPPAASSVRWRRASSSACTSNWAATTRSSCCPVPTCRRPHPPARSDRSCTRVRAGNRACQRRPSAPRTRGPAV